jgi:hypothetical protein
MDFARLKREGLSVALMAVYSLEAGLVAAGWFGNANGLFISTTTIGLILSLRLAGRSRSIWPTIMVASHLIALACLLLGRRGDAVVLAAWGAAHAPALIAMSQGLLQRSGALPRLTAQVRPTPGLD